MDDSSAMATGMVDIDKSGETSSEITQQLINNEPSIDQAMSFVNGEMTEEISSVGDHTSAGLPLSKATASHKPTNMTAQASIASPMDTTVEAPLLTTTAITTEISSKNANSQSNTSDVPVSASVPSMYEASTMKTAIQTGIAKTSDTEKVSPSLPNVTMATANTGLNDTCEYSSELFSRIYLLCL